jgi:hypothetical protein
LSLSINPGWGSPLRTADPHSAGTGFPVCSDEDYVLGRQR